MVSVEKMGRWNSDVMIGSHLNWEVEDTINKRRRLRLN